MPKKPLRILNRPFLFFVAASTIFSTGIRGVLAQNANSETLNGLNETAGKIKAFSGKTNDDYGTEFIASRAGEIIGLVLSFIGILFLALMIYAGIGWMTAAGNDQKITKSKDLLINATIGLILVFSAYAITVFIGKQFLSN